MRQTIVLNSLVFVIFLSACSAFQPQPTTTPTMTATSSPTATCTVTPTWTPTLTFTPRPTITSMPTETPGAPTATLNAAGLVLPTGKPLEEWNDIPIMPNAIAGDESQNSNKTDYTFTIRGDIQKVVDYYGEQLWLRRWDLYAESEGAPNSKILFFSKDNDQLSIFVTIADKPNRLLLVMLVLL